MRVGVVMHHLPAPGAGGVEGQVHELCTGLMDRGVQVHVVCRPSLYLPAPRVPLWPYVTAVPDDRIPADSDTAFLTLWRTSRDLAAAADWASFDIVHVQSHYGYHTGLQVAQMSGPRPALVSTSHLTAIGGMLRLQELGFPQEPDLDQTQPATVMEATLARIADRCIAVSQQVQDDLTRGYGAAPERVSVVYNGIDTDVFAPLPAGWARSRLGLDPALRYVLYVGPFFGSRGRMLLDSLPDLDADVRVLAIWPPNGSSPPDGAGDRLICVGYVPRVQLPLYYAAADLLAYPLLYTGFGLALLEASACGCVPVAFNLRPMTEVVAQSAWLVDQINAHAFAATVNRALRDPDTRRKAAAGIGAARESRFTRDHMVDHTLRVYEAALEYRGLSSRRCADGSPAATAAAVAPPR
jgi:glycosyltransferase involved in cell wall biosynthesis